MRFWVWNCTDITVVTNETMRFGEIMTFCSPIIFTLRHSSPPALQPTGFFIHHISEEKAGILQKDGWVVRIGRGGRWNIV